MIVLLIGMSAARGGVIWSDSFDDGNDTASPTWVHWTPWGAGTGGPTWTVEAGRYHLRGQQTGSVYGIGSYVAQTMSDAHVGAEMIACSPNLQNDRGLLARMSPSFTFYGLTVDCGGSAVDLLKYRNGTPQKDLVASFAFAPGASYQLLLETVNQGPNVLVRSWVWRTGQPRPVAPLQQWLDTSSPITSGYAGLVGYTEERQDIAVCFDRVFVRRGAVPETIPEPSSLALLVWGVVLIRRRT